jgi:hypothetical protein
MAMKWTNNLDPAKARVLLMAVPGAAAIWAVVAVIVSVMTQIPRFSVMTSLLLN